MSVYLDDREVRDLQSVLLLAIHELTHPLHSADARARLVDNLSAIYDALLTDEQRARRTAMLDRLHKARAAQ